MTRSVYTLCGFEKNKPVGFCAFCEIRGNYIQRNHKYKRGGRLYINDNYTNHKLYVHYTSLNIIRSLYEHQNTNLPNNLLFVSLRVSDEPFVIYIFVQIYVQKRAYSPYINVKAGKKGGLLENKYILLQSRNYN